MTPTATSRRRHRLHRRGRAGLASAALLALALPALVAVPASAAVFDADPHTGTGRIWHSFDLNQDGSQLRADIMIGTDWESLPDDGQVSVSIYYDPLNGEPPAWLAEEAPLDIGVGHTFTYPNPYDGLARGRIYYRFYDGHGTPIGNPGVNQDEWAWHAMSTESCVPTPNGITPNGIPAPEWCEVTSTIDDWTLWDLYPNGPSFLVGDDLLIGGMWAQTRSQSHPELEVTVTNDAGVVVATLKEDARTEDREATGSVVREEWPGEERWVLEGLPTGTYSMEFVLRNRNGFAPHLYVAVLEYENPPVYAADDRAATRVETPVAINVLENDYMVDEVLAVSGVDADAGSVEVEDGWRLIFHPAPGFIGTAQFEYTGRALYGMAPTLSATVTVDVLPPEAIPGVPMLPLEPATPIEGHPAPAEPERVPMVPLKPATPKAPTAVEPEPEPTPEPVRERPDPPVAVVPPRLAE